MKKFFKILLKTILWLILWIIVIVSIGLVIINNKTLKFYKNDDGNIKFTMNRNFNMKEWNELKINLKNFEIIFSDIKDYQIYNKLIFNLKFKKINNIFYYKWGNIYEEREYTFLKNNSNNYTIVTWYYIDGNIFRVWKFLDWNNLYNYSDYDEYSVYYDENWNIIWTWSNLKKEWLFLTLSRNDWSISDYLEYIDWKVNWFVSIYDFNDLILLKKYNIKDWKSDWLYIEYYKNWNIMEEWNYINWERIWIRSWYYEDWNIKYSKNYKDWILNWIYLKYYKNWDIMEEWNYINNDLWNYKYYNKLWNFIWSWETVCLSFSWDNCIEKQKNWLYIEYFENLNEKNIFNYKNWKLNWRQFLYFNRLWTENNKSKQILLEWYFIDWKKIFTIERELWDYNSIILY